MRIFRHFETLPDDARGAAVAIGNFDGVHPGHRAVINEAGLIARDENVPWAVLTFEPHPRQLFVPDQPPFRLTPFRSKAHEIEAMGVDMLIVQRFNRAFSKIEAEDFVLGECGVLVRHKCRRFDVETLCKLFGSPPADDELCPVRERSLDMAFNAFALDRAVERSHDVFGIHRIAKFDVLHGFPGRVNYRVEFALWHQ